MGGEDRNRTYLATCGATTVLKTARATRHPSLSQKKKMSNVQHPTSKFLARRPRFGVRQSATERIRSGELDAAFEGLIPSDGLQKRKHAFYNLAFLIVLTIWSKSGQSPVSSLEWSSLPLVRISKAPPLEGISVSDLIRSPSSRILAAKLTAFGV